MLSQVPADDAGLDALCRRIERERGFFCSSYKDSCVRRRISVRMRIKGAATFAEYESILDHDEREYDRLIATLTVNVSRFFRNPETFARIATKVIPQLWRPSGSATRVWSAGCASGEEAYSLAVLWDQHAELSREASSDDRVEILGTDVDGAAVAAARRAHYPEAAFADTTPAVRDTYFPPSDGLRAASPVLRRLVSFEQADLIDVAAAPSGVHLIVCRNVLIYFRRKTQEALLEGFYHALAPGGFLVLGKVETPLGSTRGMFEPVSSRERIYRRVDGIT
jgi:chemotaxis protein methyltransferase CheR